MTLIHTVASFVTDFADEAVVIPGAFCVAVVLAMVGWLRGAAVWVAGLSATLALVLLLKLTFMACGHRLDMTIESPSGHAAAAGVFYGTLLALAVRRYRPSMAVQLGCVLVVVLVVGTSRLVLGAHTLAEVCVGGAVGTLGAAWILWTIGQPPMPHGRISGLLLPVLALLCVLHGLRMPAEAAIRAVALELWPLSACR